MNRPSEEIINNVLSGLATKDEAALVAKWFATDEGQKYVSERLDADFVGIEKGFENISPLYTIPSENIWNKIHRRTFYKKRISNPFLKIAAIVIPLFILLSVVLYRMNDLSPSGNIEYTEIYIPKGEMGQITFDDGTSVYLNSDTRLTYPKQFSSEERRVKLDGEAYFTVEKDANRPFIVEANQVFVEVLGTSFNVKSYSDDAKIDVALDEGKINFISSTQEKFELYPQDMIEYDKTTESVVLSNGEDAALASKWRNETITFNNTPLSEVIKTLARMYNVVFEVQDQKALEFSYTLTSQKVDLEEILSDMEKISPVQFVFNKDTIQVKMK